MANFGNRDLTGQNFGPRHSSPNPCIPNNSPRPPNVGPIPNIPPIGSAGPHMRLFNPMTMPPMARGLMPPAVVPWGAGVMAGIPMIPSAVPPYIPPQMPMPGTAVAMQQIEQSNTLIHPTNQNKERRQENSQNADVKHSDRKHHHSRRRRYEDDRHHKRRGRHSGSRDHDRKRDSFSPGRERDKKDSERSVSGAILRDDRDEGDDNLGPRRSGGAILLEDGEIDSDGAYSLHEEKVAYSDGRENPSAARSGSDCTDSRYDADDRNDPRYSMDNRYDKNNDSRYGTDNRHDKYNDSRYGTDKKHDKYNDSRYGTDKKHDKYNDSRYETDNRFDKYKDSRYDTDNRHDKLSSRHDNDKRHGKNRSRHENEKRPNSNGSRHDRRHNNQDSRTDSKKRHHASRHSEDDRRNESNHRQVPERSECHTGRSGAILREDRDDGPVLLEDSVVLNAATGRTGAVLIEDRNDADYGENLDLDDRSQRSRSDVDRNSQRKRFESDRNIRENESIPSRQEFGNGRGRDRSKGAGRKFTESSVRNSLDRERSLDVPPEANRGRTGALLLEDRDVGRNQRGGGTDKGRIGRSGALLIEDRNSGAPLDKGQRGHGKSVRSQGHRGKSKPARDRLGRRSGSRDLKRSRSPSFSDLRVKREPKSIEKEEPEIKKRKIWEPGPNDISTAKCIRTASQTTMQDMDTLFSEQVANWVRCSAADLYFKKDPKTGNMVSTKRMQELEELFDNELVQRAAKVTALQEPYERPELKPNWKHKCGAKHHHHCGGADHNHDDSSPSSSDSSDSESDSEDWWMDEFKFKQNNPYRLHKEVWYNDPNELNYGPLCRCSNKARQFGIRHSIYPGEKPLPLCDMNSNNLDKLYHYRVNVSPVKNFLINEPTVIMFDEHEYIFEGFSIFSHKPIPEFPDCQLIRFNIIYTIHVVEEQVPENFSVRSLDLFTEFLFDEILELIDIDWRGPGDGNQCRRYHIMPRFARPFPENGKELLSMNDVLLYLLKVSKPLMTDNDLEEMFHLDADNWTKFVDSFRHMVVTCPGKKPSAIRIDQLDKADCKTEDGYRFPVIIHHGVRPAQLSYAGDPSYRKKWREYMKYRHLLWTRCKVGAKEKERLEEFEAELEKIRMKCTMKREVTAEIDSEGFLLTGIRADICQHAMLLPVLIEHLRFHECLSELEDKIKYKFKDRSLLQLALTHSSYKVNYGTNPDHGRNSLSNCGFRQVKFGDFKIHLQHTRKRGLNILLKIMAKMGHKEEVRSEIPHNERLEFLGDAVVEFITSTHLFNMFPQASEGELTLYRGSLVQNAHLAVLADKLRLQDFLLYAHGPDLCHDSNLKHAMANCFEAFLGALFMDGGIELADKVFSENLFHEEDLLDTWVNTPPHPLISDEPIGDRHWIEQSPVLQKLTSFEEDIGYEFRHVRLLAKAFTQRNVGYNNLTFGHNQRMEFLGDTVMQLICSEYLFRHFPDHHEGHLTLLRSSLVNNKTQSTVAAELGMPDFVIKANMTKVDEKCQMSADLKTKEKADLLEALLGALLVDGGLEPCKILVEVCFLPRLQDFILDQEWNDPKSELQQCCLTLREINDETPDIPVYKVLKASGPTNQRTYTVAVYFREKRLAVGTGGGIQQAEMKAAEAALSKPGGLFHNRLFNSKNKRLNAAAKLDSKVKKEIK